jgi:hypothetical protein
LKQLWTSRKRTGSPHTATLSRNLLRLESEEELGEGGVDFVDEEEVVWENGKAFAEAAWR